MNDKLASAFLGVLACASVSLGAAEEKSYRAEFPKGDAAWNVAFQKEKGAPEAAKPGPDSEKPEKGRDIKNIRIVRKGDLRRDSVTWTDGTSTEYWWSKGAEIAVFQTDKSGPVHAMRGGLMDARRLDESLFAWVGSATLKEPQEFLGRKCLYFETRVPLVDDETELYQAWLDAENLRPVAWSNGASLAVFAFESGVPKDVLVMPAEFKKKLERYEAYIAPPKKLASP
jgi:hypothetical protein